jgi:prepilin peptidase CpaA
MDESYLMIFYVSFGVYVLLLIVAAAFDTWKFVIPNAITVGLVALFIATTLLLPFEMGWRDWLSHFGAAFAVFVGGAVLYAMNKLGGGDVKLLTAVAFWAGFDHLAEMLIYVTLAGGALAIGLIVVRRLLLGLRTARPALGKLRLPRVLLDGEAVPYALAIAPSSIYLGTELPQLGVDIWF